MGIDLLDCGKTNNEDETDDFVSGPASSMIPSPIEFKRKKILRIARWVILVQAILFCAIGLYGIIKPKSLVFNVVINEYYAEHLSQNLEEYEKKLDRLTEIHDKELEANSKSSTMWKIAMMLVDAPDSTKDDMKEALEGYEKAQEMERMKHPEEVALMAPTQLACSMMLAIGIYSALIRWLGIAEINKQLAQFFIIWHSCILIGMIAAVTHRGEGLSSSLFTVGLTLMSIVFTAVWALLRERLSSLPKMDQMDELSMRSV